jgi:transposase InsO family protein
MNVHNNARTTFHGRLLMVRRILVEHQPPAEVAADLGVSARTAYKWLARYRAEGEAGLHDRSSAPRRCPHRLPPERLARVEALRREERLTGPKIAARLGLPASTVGLVLRRARLGRLPALEPPAPVVRYERARPGELLHIDTKKLGRIDGVGHRIHGDRRARQRGIGWEALHVCVDDAARLAYTEVLPDECAASAVGFLTRALAWFARHGVTVERVMTDNGSAYRSRAFRQACAAAGVRHRRTRPYRPQTNGKAERFIQTVLRECAYARPFASSRERAEALRPWTETYNRHRPHAALNRRPPFSRLSREQPAC